MADSPESSRPELPSAEAEPDPEAGSGSPRTASGIAHTELGEAPQTGGEASAPAAEPWIGRVLDDRYEIESILGEGGMGAVYVARHLKLHKQVALKVIRAELAGNGEVAIRFAREAMATAQFEHPHVASAIDYGALPEGGAYFVMQLVRGRSLREFLEDGPLPWRTACNVAAQVADALSAARASSIVHRDLKPDNILVETRDDGSQLVKILDFGIAHVAPSEEPAPEGAMPNRELTRVGTIMGTPGYMSPEQAVGDRVDHRTDLYALGVVLWECVAGKELWDGPDITSIITRQMSEEPPALADASEQKDIPDELNSIVQQLLNRKPEERPEHAGLVRDALRELEQRTSAPAQAASGTHEAIERVSQVAREGQAQASRLYTRFRAQPPEAQKKQAMIGGAALLVLVAVAMFSGPSTTKTAAPAKKDIAATVVEQVVQVAKEVVQPKVAAMVTPGIPVALADEVHTMIEGARRADRKDAAKKVLAHEPKDEVAKYLLAIAELETVSGCRSRKKAISEIVELGDKDALPALERWKRAPKQGCGFLNLQDCYRCIRRPIRKAIATLSGEAQAK